MPRVPTSRPVQGKIEFTSSVSPERTLALGQSIGDSLGSAVRPLERHVAGTIQARRELEAARQAQRAREERNNAFTSFSRELDNLGRDVAEQDDIGAISSTFEARGEELRGNIGRNISDDGARAAYAEGSQKLMTAHLASMGNIQFKRELAAGEAALESNLSELSDSVVIAPPGAKERLVVSGVGMINDSEIIRAEDKPAAVEAFLAGVDIKSVRRLIDLADATDNEEEAIALLVAAEGMLKDPEDTPSLTSTQRTNLRRDVAAEQSEAVNGFNAGRRRKMTSQIAEMSTPTEIFAAKASIDTLAESNVITESEAIHADNQFRARIDRLSSADSGAQKVADSIAFGLLIDPKDMKDIDAYMEEIFLPDLVDATPEELRDAKIDLVDDIDVLPSIIEKELRAKTSNGTPTQVAEAAELFVAMRNVSPQATARMGDETATFLENVDASVVLGVPVKQAVSDAREIAKLSPDIAKGRRQHHAFLQGDQRDGDWLVKNSDAFRIVLPYAFDPSTDDIGPGLQKAFSAEVQRQHTLDPNIEKSLERALSKMKLSWGVTNTSGEPRIMYMAPELMYKQLNNDSEEISRQIVADLTLAGTPEVADLGADEIASRIMLSADEDSMREHDPDTGALTPGYNVFLLGDDGGDTLQLLDENNIPMRFFPDDQRLIEERRADSLKEAKEGQKIKESSRAAISLLRRSEENAGFAEALTGLTVPTAKKPRRIVEP